MMHEQKSWRFRASGSAGQRDGKKFAVIDTQDKQGGKGARRVSFHKTFRQAQAAAKRMNEGSVD